MKMRVFAVLLAIILVFALLPGAALAAGPYNVWVQGTQVTDTNKGNVLGDGTGSYKARCRPRSQNRRRRHAAPVGGADAAGYRRLSGQRRVFPQETAQQLNQDIGKFHSLPERSCT